MKLDSGRTEAALRKQVMKIKFKNNTRISLNIIDLTQNMIQVFVLLEASNYMSLGSVLHSSDSHVFPLHITQKNTCVFPHKGCSVNTIM